MDSYNKKCKGCGNWLSANQNDIGYVPNYDETKNFCMRCFKLQNYGKMTQTVSNEVIAKELSELDPENNLVILVVNLFDLQNSLYENAKKYKNILIVVNNLAALPKKFYFEKALNNLRIIFESQGFDPIDIIFYDGLRLKRIGSINEYILQAYELKKKIYIIGKTNVGKSTLINALLKYNKIKQKLTVSPLKNTTLGFNKIKINRTEIIDTPGFPNEFNILNNLNQKFLKKINKNIPVNKNFQIFDDEQMFFIEKLFGFIFYKTDLSTNISFYLLSNFQILRSKVKPVETILNNQQMNLIDYETKKKFKMKSEVLNSKFKYNLFIPGIALVSFQGIEKIDLFVPENINYFLTQNIII